MSVSLLMSPPGGGGGGGSWMFFLSRSIDLLSMEILFLSVVLFVISSPTSNWFGSTSPVDVQLQLFFCRSDCSVFSKDVFGSGGAP